MADAEMEEIARQLAECQLEDEKSTSQERRESVKRCIEVTFMSIHVAYSTFNFGN